MAWRARQRDLAGRRGGAALPRLHLRDLKGAGRAGQTSCSGSCSSLVLLHGAAQNSHKRSVARPSSRSATRCCAPRLHARADAPRRRRGAGGRTFDSLCRAPPFSFPPKTCPLFDRQHRLTLSHTPTPRHLGRVPVGLHRRLLRPLDLGGCDDVDVGAGRARRRRTGEGPARRRQLCLIRVGHAPRRAGRPPRSPHPARRRSRRGHAHARTRRRRRPRRGGQRRRRRRRGHQAQAQAARQRHQAQVVPRAAGPDARDAHPRRRRRRARVGARRAPGEVRRRAEDPRE